MKYGVTIIGAVLICGLAAVAGFFTHQWLGSDTARPVFAAPETDTDSVGSRRPEFSLPDLEGVLRTPAEWDGQVIVINFWATWCPPCREEIPAFIALQDELGAQGLQFIGIALQDADEVREYVIEMGMNYPVLTGYREVIKIAKSYGNHMGALPYTVVIDRQGIIRMTQAGPLSAAAARSAIVAHLE